MEEKDSPNILVHLIDSCFRRRAAISHLLQGAGLHVEPFECALDFMNYPTDDGIVLVHDEGDQVAAVRSHLNPEGRWLPHVVYSEVIDRGKVVDSIRRGAQDFLVWRGDGRDFTNLIIEAQHVTRPLAEARRGKLAARERLDRLTPRERGVLEFVASGLSNRVIATRLGISNRTVEVHRTNAIAKMAANNSAEAVRMALQAGMFPQ
jgi:FixJ family two-component response regulator